MAGELKKRAQHYLDITYGGSPARQREKAAEIRAKGHPNSDEAPLKGLGDSQLDKLIANHEQAMANRLETHAAIIEHLQTRLGDGK